VSASRLACTLTSASIVPNDLYPFAVLGLLLHHHFHTVFTRLSDFGAHGNAADKELSRIALQDCLERGRSSPAIWSTSLLSILGTSSVDKARSHLALFPGVKVSHKRHQRQ
jgi:hypothetical protein